MAISSFPELAGSLTRDEIHQILTAHPDLSLLGGEQEVDGQLLAAFVSRNTDLRVLALFFRPDAEDSTRWMLIGWAPVPRASRRRRLQTTPEHSEETQAVQQ
jgi:hypothetical protein